MAKTVTLDQLEDSLERVAEYFVVTNQDMTGATSSAAGAKGMVPAPSSGDNTKFLRGDGTWAAAGGAASITVKHYVDVYNPNTGSYDLPVPAVTV